MTTPSTAPGWTEAPRLVAAWALVGYAGAYLAFAFFDWLLPGDGTIAERSAGANFTNLVVLAMPVVAVLLATHVQPTLPRAKTIVTVALIEYAAILLFGLLALLIGVGAVADGPYREREPGVRRARVLRARRGPPGPGRGRRAGDVPGVHPPRRRIASRHQVADRGTHATGTAGLTSCRSN